ncbi:MAG: glycosyltransferase [Candidatus Omnitrophica bacterium]|nr:glycosyltransferase [Candidatus Omnitrophota bacterium]
MKIIFITREGYDLAGARIRCYNFSREIASSGIKTEVFSFKDCLGAKDGQEESEMNFREKIKYNYLAFKKISQDKEAILYLQRFNYHALAPYLAHLVNKNRLILDLDDWEMREDPRYLCGVWPLSKAHFFTKRIARSSVICIAASSFLQQFLAQFNKKVYLVPTGVDTELFRPSSERSNKDKVIFSWVGTFHKNEYINNLKLAIDCFMALRNKYDHIYFEIAGDGIHKNSIGKIINENGDPHILLKEWIRPGDMPEYLDNIDIGLLPIAEDNNFNRAKSPTKLFEYMAMAKPAICSSIGEAKNIIKDGESGLLAGTKDEFIKKMQFLVENPGLSRKIGINARRIVQENFSLRILGKRLCGAFKAMQC